MKKLVLLSAVWFILLGHACAQVNEVPPMINLGTGLSDFGFPVYLGVEYPVHQNITIGAMLSWRAYNEKLGPVDYDHKSTGLLAQGLYYFDDLIQTTVEWDFFAGLAIGYYFVNTKTNVPGSSYSGDLNSGVGVALMVGGRYWLSDHWGIRTAAGLGTYNEFIVALTYGF